MSGSYPEYCTECGVRLNPYDNYPAKVFDDGETLICEDCSIDFYEDDHGNIRKRVDL